MKSKSSFPLQEAHSSNPSLSLVRRLKIMARLGKRAERALKEMDERGWTEMDILLPTYLKPDHRVKRTAVLESVDLYKKTPEPKREVGPPLNDVRIEFIPIADESKNRLVDLFTITIFGTGVMWNHGKRSPEKAFVSTCLGTIVAQKNDIIFCAKGEGLRSKVYTNFRYDGAKEFVRAMGRAIADSLIMHSPCERQVMADLRALTAGWAYHEGLTLKIAKSIVEYVTVALVTSE